MTAVHRYDPARELALFFATQYVGDLVEEYPAHPYHPEEWHDIDQPLLAHYRALGVDVLTRRVLSGSFRSEIDAGACSLALLVEHHRTATVCTH